VPLGVVLTLGAVSEQPSGNTARNTGPADVIEENVPGQVAPQVANAGFEVLGATESL
jgi:hypothetical protein